DGLILAPINRFDLGTNSIVFIPVNNGYDVAVSRFSGFEPPTNSARRILLGDDDTSEIPLPFPFVFYGKTYTSVFLNSDGNLTFTAPDALHTQRNLNRIVSGPPRIAPLLDDLNPGASGLITVEYIPSQGPRQP